MTDTDSAIRIRTEAISASRHRSGLAWGILGVFAFSFSFPMTRLAVAGIDPVLVGLGRAVAAAFLAAAWLALRRARPPALVLWPRLALVAAGVVVGFPLLSSIALRTVPAAHGAVITGLLPVATAVMAVLRAGERPPWRFWAVSAVGLAAVLVFAAVQGAGRPVPADGLILLAVLAGGLSYAEGGALARRLGGAQVICWALLVSLPLLLPVIAWRLAALGWPRADAQAWGGFAYLAVVSMFLGFFAWYRGLALGGIARVGQVQLGQPVLTLLWSALLLGERITGGMALAAAAVLGSVVLTQAAHDASPTTAQRATAQRR